MDRLNGNDEVLSAWFDDEYAEPATDLDLEAILRDPNTRSTWGTYALIGAALRGCSASRSPAPKHPRKGHWRAWQTLQEGTERRPLPQQTTRGGAGARWLPRSLRWW
jgi:hypothetical protein